MNNDNAWVEFQKKQAAECFNKTWDYIDKQDRTLLEEREMIHCAHASRYLWGQVGTPINLERGEWLISKVYYLSGNGERALYHAKACCDICIENNIADFDITFAYESMANAYKLLGNSEKSALYKEKAFTSLQNIHKQEDRDYAESELQKI